MFSKIMWTIVIFGILLGINGLIQQKVAPAVADAQLSNNVNLSPVVPPSISAKPAGQVPTAKTTSYRTTNVTSEFLTNWSGWLITFVGILIFWPMWRKDIKKGLKFMTEGSSNEQD